MIRRFLDRLQPLALLVMRCTLGAIMIAHGWLKVSNGHFGEKMAATVASMGFPGWLGYVVTWLEFLGGMLIIAGILTRVLGLLFTVEMAVAIWKVHGKNGFVGPGGYEFALAVGVIAFALIWFGGGLISVDHLIVGGGHKAGR